MATNKPQLPKGKGRGRYDKTHQIALLTDFEVEALNHLRWKDKERGFSSGSGPEIKELAKKNSRPFSFVDYKGEKIPTLNDSGSYGGGESGSGSTGGNITSGDSGGGGESNWARTRRLKEEKRQRELKAEKKRRQDIADKAAAKKEAKEKYEREEAAKKKRAADIKRINRYVALQRKKSGEFYNEEYQLQEPSEDEDEFVDPDILDISTTEDDTFVDPSILGGDDPDPDPDDGGLTKEEFEALTEEHGVETFLDEQGGVHLSQDEADKANRGFATTKKLGEAEGFEYGTAVTGTDEEGNVITDEEGNVITTDKSLTGTYKGAYETLLADAYDAAKTGVGSGIAGSGGLPTYGPTTYAEDDVDKENPIRGAEIDPYAALESAVAGQGTYLDTLAANYQTEAKGRYDDWLSTNTAAINAITGENAEGVSALDQIKNYVWTDMPEYDKDWSGGYVPGATEDDPQVWDENWMPDFYSGFNKEYGKDYLGPDSWKYDDQGNLIPGSYEPNTTGTTSPEEEETTTTTRSASRMAPGIPSGKKGATGVAQYGRSAARYI